MVVPIVGGMLMGAAASSVIHPVTNQMTYAMNELCPNNLPGPDQLIRAFQRGSINRAQLNKGMAKLGFGDVATEAMLGAARAPLDPQSLLRLKRMGKISDEEYYNSLIGSGMSPDAARGWEAANEYIPTPQDMVRFGVREAFSPELAEQLGLYEDIPPDYLEACKLQGMSQETAELYWASHWNLPSLSNAFEMFHRGEISEEDLENLMRAQDYSPAWRDTLQSLSYNPYTRVDTRRMFLEGTLSEDEVYENLKWLGYDDEKATNMLTWMKGLKTKKEEAEAAKAAKTTKTKASAVKSAKAPKGKAAKDRDLSLGLIRTAYYYDELDIKESKELVKKLDFDGWETDLILNVWDAQLIEKDHKKAIKNIELEFARGLISEADMSNKFGELNLRGTIIDLLVEQNKIKRIGKEKIPSKADCVAFLKKGLITPVEFAQRLYNMNYSMSSIDLYLGMLGYG